MEGLRVIRFQKKGVEWPGENLGDHLDEISELTQWFSLERLKPEGPYESIILGPEGFCYFPTEGPLRGTVTQWPRFWCALDNGQLIVADKTSNQPPPFKDKEIKIRGYYDADESLENMLWYTIGEAWNENEITAFNLLSNVSYRNYAKVPSRPEHIFLFGAGASYGSDSEHLLRKGKLPPLGYHLFEALRQDPAPLELWRKVPAEVEEIFVRETFERGMEELDQLEAEKARGIGRDIELATFFGKFRARPSNLYCRLAFRVAEKMASGNWTGAFITLNYERLLEESLLIARLFPAVKGVTFYDELEPRELRPQELMEICYPHGACHFIYPNNFVTGNVREGLILGEMSSVTGVNHIINPFNLDSAFKANHFPLVCRYQKDKRPSFNNYFIKGQKERCGEIIASASLITAVGIQCSHDVDDHLWGPLADTKAKIMYFEPSASGCDKFRAWARSTGKAEGTDFGIVQETFHDGFLELLKCNDLR